MNFQIFSLFVFLSFLLLSSDAPARSILPGLISNTLSSFTGTRNTTLEASYDCTQDKLPCPYSISYQVNDRESLSRDQDSFVRTDDLTYIPLIPSELTLSSEHRVRYEKLLMIDRPSLVVTSDYSSLRYTAPSNHHFITETSYISPLVILKFGTTSGGSWRNHQARTVHVSNVIGDSPNNNQIISDYLESVSSDSSVHIEGLMDSSRPSSFNQSLSGNSRAHLNKENNVLDILISLPTQHFGRSYLPTQMAQNQLSFPLKSGVFFHRDVPNWYPLRSNIIPDYDDVIYRGYFPLPSTCVTHSISRGFLFEEHQFRLRAALGTINDITNDLYLDHAGSVLCSRFSSSLRTYDIQTGHLLSTLSDKMLLHRSSVPTSTPSPLPSVSSF